MIDGETQDRVLACMQRVPEFIAVAAQYLKAEYFESTPRKNICMVMTEFWGDYSTMVTDPGFNVIVKGLVDDGKIKKIEIEPHLRKWKHLKTVVVSDYKFVLDELVNFIKHQRIKALINESVAKHLPAGNYATIEKEMAKIASINAAERVAAYDYFAEKSIEERSAARAHELKVGKVAISTGIKPLDDKLHAGGFYQKELYIVMAPPKRGKSMALLYFSNQASLQGYNVAHFSCEVSKEVCCNRLDAMNSKTLVKEVKVYHASVAGHVRSKGDRGKMFIFEYPTKSLTPGMISERISRILREDGVKIDMIVVDYLDIMTLPNPDRSSSWSDQGPLAEELRRLAWEFCLPVVTATQINRGGAGKATSSGKDVSGSYEKVMIADELFNLAATDDELKAGKLRIIISESRNSEIGTVAINTAFAYGQFFQDYIGEEI